MNVCYITDGLLIGVLVCSLFNVDYLFQAFINTAGTIYKKIQEGVFDVSNEVSFAV